MIVFKIKLNDDETNDYFSPFALVYSAGRTICCHVGYIQSFVLNFTRKVIASERLTNVHL